MPDHRPHTSPSTETVTELRLEGIWRVVVLNDPVNLMSYVVLVFKKVFGFDEATARKHMLEVHEQGRSIVWSGFREKAEAYAFTLQQWHLTAVIESDDAKRIEITLALPVVAPLLDVIKELAEGLRKNLAAPLQLEGLDPEFREAWVGELLSAQNDEIHMLLAMFDEEFFREGKVAFDDDNAEIIVRACAAVRLRLRERYLKPLGDETLETGDVDLMELGEPLKKAFMCYLFLATLQELIIQHLDENILGA